MEDRSWNGQVLPSFRSHAAPRGLALAIAALCLGALAAPPSAQAQAASAAQSAADAATRAEAAATDASATLESMKTPEAGVPTEGGDLEEAIREAESAAEEAREAAKEAREVAEEARGQLDEYRERYARTGPFIGGAGFYAIEDFDTSLSVDNSRGWAAFAGYRVHKHVAVEIRGEVFSDFDIEGNVGDREGFDASLDGYAITANAKFYPFLWSIQPFVGFGLGAMDVDLKGVDENGQRIDESETEGLVRFAAGFDYFLSENLVLNLEGAYLSPGSDLDSVEFANLSAGLTFRF